MAIINKIGKTSNVDVGKLEPLRTIGGKIKCASALENSLAAPQKASHKPSTGAEPGDRKTMSTLAQLTSGHNSPEVEIPQLPYCQSPDKRINTKCTPRH